MKSRRVFDTAIAREVRLAKPLYLVAVDSTPGLQSLAVKRSFGWNEDDMRQVLTSKPNFYSPSMELEALHENRFS